MTRFDHTYNTLLLIVFLLALYTLFGFASVIVVMFAAFIFKYVVVEGTKT